MKYLLLLLILSFYLAHIYAQYIISEEATDNEFQPPEMFFKRSSLSNMMRLGKRGYNTMKKSDLGNLMRLGR